MQIAFWSTVHGQTATTSNAIALTLSIALHHDYKILIGHSHASRSTLERSLTGAQYEQQNMLTFSDHGMDALTRLAKNGRLSSDMIHNYTTPILSKSRLDMMMGTTQKNIGELQEQHQLLQQIFNYANQYYDLVAIDVHSGLSHQLTRTLLEHSQLIVICLNQNKAVLNDFLEVQEYKDFFKDKKHVVCLGMFNKLSKQSIKNTIKQYRFNPVITVPYHIGFQNSCNNCNVVDYFIRNMYVRKTDPNYAFFHPLREASRVLLKELEQLNKVGGAYERLA